MLVSRWSTMQLCHYINGCFLVLVVFLQLAFAEDSNDRSEKLISTFQIVRFPNDVCVGSNSRNGTCYTSAECSDKDGTSSGSCADGFGVCCTFVITSCGSSSSENITYWTTASITTGDLTTCGLTVCPASDEICSLRIDFTTFVITGPNTLSIVTNRRKFGTPGAADLTDTTHFMTGGAYTTNCLYDSFGAQGASPSSSPPEVCGTLTGTHMYVEADVDRCNNLQFNFADYASTAAVNIRGVSSLTSRSWDLTVTQIECTSPVLPPVGCTQFFWGSTGKYVLENYNYRGTSAVTSNAGIHLANQNQRMCIRREKGNCVGCFVSNGVNGFKVSGSVNTADHFAGAGGCCGYLDIPSGGHLASAEGSALTQGNAQIDFAETATSHGLQGFDCIIIPGAFVPATDDGEVGEAAAEADTGTPVASQVATVIQAYNSEENYMTPSGPQICGQGNGIGIGGTSVSVVAVGTGNVGQGIASFGETPLTVCSRSDPFILEFMTDDVDGQGGSTAELNSEIKSATQAANLGFSITHTQLECS